MRKCKYPYTNGCKGFEKLRFIRKLVRPLSLSLSLSLSRFRETRSPTLAILPSYREDKWNPRRRECSRLNLTALLWENFMELASFCRCFRLPTCSYCTFNSLSIRVYNPYHPCTSTSFLKSNRFRSLPRKSTGREHFNNGLTRSINDIVS